MLLEELKDLRTHLEVKLVKNGELAAPFPSLNKDISLGVSSVETVNDKCCYGATPCPEISLDRDGLLNPHEACKGEADTSQSMHGGESAVIEDHTSSDGTRFSSRAATCRDLPQEFLEVLQDAVKVRVCNSPQVSCSHLCEESEDGSEVVVSNARVAVLFSGGVDSAVLAALVDRYVLIAVGQYKKKGLRVILFSLIISLCSILKKGLCIYEVSNIYYMIERSFKGDTNARLRSIMKPLPAIVLRMCDKVLRLLLLTIVSRMAQQPQQISMLCETQH